MERVVGIRFKKAGRVYYFNAGDKEIAMHDGIVAETIHGMEFGEVVIPPRDLSEEQLVAPLKDIVRVATEEDRLTNERNEQLENEAFELCQKKINERGMEMKLVDVEYTFNGSKITFFFTSEGRVDFRDLVKDLAAIYKTRIELRQIGVRDEAKMLGGLGSCGRPVCCKTFLADFQPVSIKMAKEQKLSLSPTKISGLCGRLMCCLKYEQDGYEEMRKLMPRVNREVMTADGKGIVLDNNAITERTRVRVTLQDGTPDVREYHFNDVRKATGVQAEEQAMQNELEKNAMQKARLIGDKEDEFRFVTGAAPEIKTPEETAPGAPGESKPAENGRFANNRPRGNRRDAHPKDALPKDTHPRDGHSHAGNSRQGDSRPASGNAGDNRSGNKRPEDQRGDSGARPQGSAKKPRRDAAKAQRTQTGGARQPKGETGGNAADKPARQGYAPGGGAEKKPGNKPRKNRRGGRNRNPKPQANNTSDGA
ncbi:MAG: hypothetical protein LBS18_05750 [Clostridiales bacterium]|nr:hypothetical protein [Clostridiales bacterium]